MQVVDYLILTIGTLGASFFFKLNQSIRHVHNCLKLAILQIKMSTNNPSENNLWFLNLVSNQAFSSAAKAWYDRRFKNH